MAMTGKTKLVLSFIVVVVLVAGWFFVSPLFIDREVDESLPGAVTKGGGEMPTRDEVAAMTPAERENAMTEVMETAAAKPDTVMDEGMSDTGGPTLVRTGQFRDADAIHKGSGSANLYRLADGSTILRFEDFRVTNGPALVVYLAKHPNPASADDVKAGFLPLGRLKGNVGNQNYVIPLDVDLSQYHSAVVWCELFDVLFSPAPLEAT